MIDSVEIKEMQEKSRKYPDLKPECKICTVFMPYSISDALSNYIAYEEYRAHAHAYFGECPYKLVYKVDKDNQIIHIYAIKYHIYPKKDYYSGDLLFVMMQAPEQNISYLD